MWHPMIKVSEKDSKKNKWKLEDIEKWELTEERNKRWSYREQETKITVSNWELTSSQHHGVCFNNEKLSKNFFFKLHALDAWRITWHTFNYSVVNCSLLHIDSSFSFKWVTWNIFFQPKRNYFPPWVNQNLYKLKGEGIFTKYTLYINTLEKYTKYHYTISFEVLRNITLVFTLTTTL